jgi:hypothetical protein
VNLHKVYLVALAAGIVLAGIGGNAYGNYERAQAARDATIATQNSDISQLKNKIAVDESTAQAQIDVLAKQSKSLASHPDQAAVIIRGTVPFSTPLQQTAPITIDTLPDAPVGHITKQQEIELAQFGNSCKECSIERDQLQSQVNDQQQIIDRQKQEIAAAERVSKGGSIVHRTLTIAKWVVVAGATGYIAGRVEK